MSVSVAAGSGCLGCPPLSPCTDVATVEFLCAWLRSQREGSASAEDFVVLCSVFLLSILWFDVLLHFIFLVCDYCIPATSVDWPWRWSESSGEGSCEEKKEMKIRRPCGLS